MKRTLTFCSIRSHISDYKEKKQISPSEFVIRNILNYAKALEVLKTENTGNVNLLMN
ncbi:MAG: hypothetical protein NTX61_10815 [Bacteroidetes bacterium]|nr:hypothetical protein [Bacteroidota bacterium]